ncbi:hypothetical protein B0T11DRAFT_343047 [Plectosphaerella cucumerina]|uniref:Uncharacterized protein n=1 Tax=Plectosphaerella cucumerina TaxID=40658 RepID=A0A8K0T6D1_9PEZI|nr:hypothetical protein B0T11DRAFT_343047 [Plectosphaerella cucumerina]
MVKKRTPTLCEWALGFSIEDFVENKQRRQNKNAGKTSPRFKLEMSTDDESGEDSLKITYPRSEQAPAVATTKKVRFEKSPVKSALKKPAPETDSSEATETTTEAESTTEAETTTDAQTTTEAETTTSGGEQSSDAADSSDSSKSSTPRRKKGKRFIMSSDSSDADSTDDSEFDSDCSCRKCRHRARHLTRIGKDKCKKTKSSSSGSDTSSSGSDQKKQKKSPKGKKGSPESNKSNKSKKKQVPVQESENDGEDETSSEEETPKKAKKTKGGRGGKDKSKNKSSSSDKEDGDGKEKKKGGKNKAKNATDNNVGPEKETPAVTADTSEKSDNSSDKIGGERKKKPLPEPGLSPDLRRPNLILPVTAQVLQVEHAIEAMEDPRPNAFHDSHHGVVRVYHGPAYGNPYGTLYPVRDSTKAMLPVGTPHPLMNPYLNGFKTTTNPGEVANEGNSHWNFPTAAPMPNAPPEKRPSPPQQYRSPPQQPQAPAVETRQAPSPPRAPAMSGALDHPGSPQFLNVYPPGWTQNMRLNGYPVNVNMYSYGAPLRGDSWSKEGRERFAKLARDWRLRRNGPDIMSDNNAGPGLHSYQGAAQNDRRSTGEKSVHPDLQWETPVGPEVASWVNEQQSGGVAGDGAGDAWGGSGNGAANNDNANGWGGSWGKPPSNNGSKNGSQTGSKSGQASGGNGSWGAAPQWSPQASVKSGGNGGSNNSPQASNKSNKSSGSNRDNAQPDNSGWGNIPVPVDNSWGTTENNVGVSSRVSSGGSKGSKDSKGSKGSKGSKKSQNGCAPADQAVDNSVGPTQAQTNDDWNKSEEPSNNMPGAFKEDEGGMQNATFHQTGPPKDTGGYSWGDTSAAQEPVQVNW